MKTIRLRRIYDYYFNSLKEMVDVCNFVRAEYIEERIGYRQALNQLTKGIRLAWSRYLLCKSLLRLMGYDSETSEDVDLWHVRNDINDIDTWMYA